jgi:hypothetical protein
VPTRRGTERIAGLLAGEGQEHVAAPPRQEVGPARVGAGHVIPRRTDQDVVVAIPVHVTHVPHLATEPLSRLEGMQVVEDHAVRSGEDQRPIGPRGTGHDVGHAVAVYIACCLDAQAQLITGLAIRGPQEAAGPAGVDVDPAGRPAPAAPGGRRGGDVVHAVAIHVADVPGNPTELVVDALSTPLVDDASGLHEGILELLGRGEEGRVPGILAEDGRRRVEIHRCDVHRAAVSRLAKPREGLVQVPRLSQGQAPVEEHGRSSRRELRSAGVRRDGLIVPGELAQGLAQEAPRATIVRLPGGEVSQQPLGAGRVTRLEPAQSLLDAWRGLTSCRG